MPIHDFGEVDGRLYVTMRLIKGRDLQTVLADGPLEPARAVGSSSRWLGAARRAPDRVGTPRCQAVQHLVAEDDFAYLIDFGIARAAGETGLTSTGATIGTWAYMSPERLNTGHADARADIYALACVLHEALTGQRPYPGDSLEQQIVGHLTPRPPDRPSCNPAFRNRWTTSSRPGMAKKPDQRYATTVELARAAHDATTVPFPDRGRPCRCTHRPARPPHRGPDPWRRHPIRPDQPRPACHHHRQARPTPQRPMWRRPAS